MEKLLKDFLRGEGDEEIFDVWWESDNAHSAIDSLITLAEQDSAKRESIKDMARLASSNYRAAVAGKPWLGIQNIRSGELGDYTGQSITNKLDGVMFSPLPEGEAPLENPNLLDIYLGYQEQEMPEYSGKILKDMVGYEDAPIYDISPYSRFEGFFGQNPSQETELKDLIFTLSPGETMDIPEGIKSVFGSNLDLGGRFKEYIGKDEEGSPFFGVQDKWDFAGEDYSPYQRLMEALMVNPINMYGRFPIDENNPIYRYGR